MRQYLGTIIAIITLLTIIPLSNAFAGNPATFNVTISIATAADITVVSGGPINFGTMNVNSSSVSSTAIDIKNTGSGSNQTYSLKLTNPSGWTAVSTTPGADQYRLSTAFDNDGAGITWGATHVLTTTSVAASATQFAGDQTGNAVPYNADRKIWLKMETPLTTSSPTQKTIAITITATVD